MELAQMSTAEWKKLAPGIYRGEDARIRIRVHSPRQMELTLDAGTTLEEAKTRRKALKKEMKAAASAPDAPPTPETQSLLHYTQRWAADRLPDLRASTRKSYLDALKLHILPEIGHLDAASITRQDVQALVRRWDRRRQPDGELYSTETTRTWWRVLRVLLRDMAADLRIEDPTERVTPPKLRAGGRHQERRTLTAEQLGALVEACEVHYPQRHAEVAVLAFGGLRSCELYALEWRDIDLKTGLIHVSRSYARGELNSTKTGDPRDVVVPDIVVEALRAHRRRLVARQVPGVETGLCFPSDVGTHRTGAALRKVFVALGEHLGFGLVVTPQVLRRTYNTLLVGAGVDRIVLRSQIGHTTEAMTSRYSGVGYDLKAAASAQLQLMVLGRKTVTETVTEQVTDFSASGNRDGVEASGRT